MNNLASIVAATMLTVAFWASAAPDTPGMGASSDAGTIFEWVDDNGRKHASDTVPDKYKGVAKPVDPGLFQIPAAQQEEARRQAEALKARAASVAPPPAADAVQAESQRQNRSAPAPSAADCAAQRRRFAASQDCFVGFTKPDGSRSSRSCANEIVPEPDPSCGPGG
jgi:hypothetical protein